MKKSVIINIILFENKENFLRSFNEQQRHILYEHSGNMKQGKCLCCN